MYVLNKARTLEGEITEREKRRKGHKVYIAHVKEGEPLEAIYVDDGRKRLVTSPVTYFNDTWGQEGRLVVSTENTAYEFLKVEGE